MNLTEFSQRRRISTRCTTIDASKQKMNAQAIHYRMQNAVHMKIVSQNGKSMKFNAKWRAIPWNGSRTHFANRESIGWGSLNRCRLFVSQAIFTGFYGIALNQTILIGFWLGFHRENSNSRGNSLYTYKSFKQTEN